MAIDEILLPTCSDIAMFPDLFRRFNVHLPVVGGSTPLHLSQDTLRWRTLIEAQIEISGHCNVGIGEMADQLIGWSVPIAKNYDAAEHCRFAISILTSSPRRAFVEGVIIRAMPMPRAEYQLLVCGIIKRANSIRMVFDPHQDV